MNNQQTELPEELKSYFMHFHDAEGGISVFSEDVEEFENKIAQAIQSARKDGEKRVAVAYQKSLLEVGKISPGLLQQINALAFEALSQEGE